MEVKERALKILNEEKVEIISDNQDREVLIKVGKKTVRIFKKPGRTLVSCSCENHPRFCKEQALCKHKLAGLKVWMDEICPQCDMGVSSCICKDQDKGKKDGRD